jgi:hypothetical protein
VPAGIGASAIAVGDCLPRDFLARYFSLLFPTRALCAPRGRPVSSDDRKHNNAWPAANIVSANEPLTRINRLFAAVIFVQASYGFRFIRAPKPTVFD